MAEAVVEERSTVPTRFFCHRCNLEISIPNTDYICPICLCGFVEELPENNADTSNNSTGPGSSGVNNDSNQHADMSNQYYTELLRQDIESLLSSRNGGSVEIRFDPRRRHSNLLTLSGNIPSAVNSDNGTGEATNANGGRRPNIDRLDAVLMDFLQSLPMPGTEFMNSHMFVMGDPGDYAWGREGLDTIVTQMLNQMETSGPPPLSMAKIQQIEKVAINSEDIEQKLQCSVCWEDFKLDEVVRKLPCSHVYHENCIVPWLNLHATCPVCRKSLNDDGSAVTNSSSNRTLRLRACPLHTTRNRTSVTTDNNVAADSVNSRSTSTANETAPSNSQGGGGGTEAGGQPDTSSGSNHVFTFDDDYMGLD